MTFLRNANALWRMAAVVLAVAALIAAPRAATAKDVLLTVTGAIAPGGERTFDRAELADLPRTQFTTSTMWTAGSVTFAGVLLSDLMDAVGGKGRTMRAVALNDYAMDIPMEDATPDGALLAYEIDGKTMSVREKGPLWLVYPYDSDVRFQTEAVYGRSVWQLIRIEVQD